MGRYAYSGSYVPGAPDDDPLFRLCEVRLHSRFALWLYQQVLLLAVIATR
jgi:hypothetical protein